MEKYLVGGAVRDLLMGKTPKDRDYLVVNSSREEMLELGYEEVGESFPVFIHPETGEEYALARVERRNNGGINPHQDFSFDTDYVTLEEDLKRRDLTINSLAMDESTGTIFDPYGGVKDLDNSILRHTSEAFSEDPLRVLRVARFKARYEHFIIANETEALIRTIGKSEEFKTLPMERVFGEFQKALQEKTAHLFVTTLTNLGAAHHFQQFLQPFELHCCTNVLMASAQFTDISDQDRYVCFAYKIKDVEAFGRGITAPAIWIKRSSIMSQAFKNLFRSDSGIVNCLYEAVSILKQEKDFKLFIWLLNNETPQVVSMVERAYFAFHEIKNSDVDAEKFKGKDFGDELRRLRFERLNVRLSIENTIGKH